MVIYLGVELIKIKNKWIFNSYENENGLTNFDSIGVCVRILYSVFHDIISINKKKIVIIFFFIC